MARVFRTGDTDGDNVMMFRQRNVMPKPAEDVVRAGTEIARLERYIEVLEDLAWQGRTSVQVGSTWSGPYVSIDEAKAVAREQIAHHRQVLQGYVLKAIKHSRRASR